MKDSPKRGRPAGQAALVISIPKDADAWLRAEAMRLGLPVGTLVELAIRRMMKGKKEPAAPPAPRKPRSSGEKIKVVKL